MFSEQKVAQMAAFFLGQTGNGRMSHLKLIKLLYLADRLAVKNLGWPMSEDLLVSMPHGPVLSHTLNLINGHAQSMPGGWDSWISDKENHEVSLRDPFDRASLTELSPAELDVLAQVWADFGHMGKWEVRDWTHENCAEWQDPAGSSKVIGYEELAKAVGLDQEAAEAMAKEIQSRKTIDEILASL